MIKFANIQRFKGAVGLLHRSRFLRKVAKQLARDLTLTQRFYGGQIAFNAVDHSWAWTGSRDYENFDRNLQDRLLSLSVERSKFVDIGANIGAMSLSILLRNPVANAVAVEPGAGAARLLRYSLRLNRLESRCEVLEVAVSAGENRLQFDPSNSVMAHVADGGPSVAAVSIVELARRIDDARPFLMKIDVEGYESALAPILHCIAAPSGSCAVIELHPAGFNGMGDPQRCFELIMGRPKLSVRALGGARLDIVDPAQFTQIEVFWL